MTEMTKEDMWTAVAGLVQINEFVAQAGGQILGLLHLEEPEEIWEAFEEIALMIESEEPAEGQAETAATVRAFAAYIGKMVEIHG